MKRKIVLMVQYIIIVGVMLSVSTEAQVNKLLPQKSGITQITLKKVWEKKFNEKIIDAIFGEVEVTVGEAKTRGWKNLVGRQDNEKVKIPYVKAVVVSGDEWWQKKEIIFYNSRGVEVKRTKEKLRWITYSPKKKYIGIIGRSSSDSYRTRVGIVYK